MPSLRMKRQSYLLIAYGFLTFVHLPFSWAFFFQSVNTAGNCWQPERWQAKLHGSTALFATSSSALKYNTTRASKKRVFSKDSVVSRLKQAAMHANIKAKEEAKNRLLETPVASEPKQGNLRQLTAAIDEHLEQSSAQIGFDRRQASTPARDSMTALIFHNDRMAANTNAAWLEKRIALVFCKPLMGGKLTVEQSERVQRLVRAIRQEEYQPDVICFLGSVDDGCQASLDHFRTLHPDFKAAFLLESTLVAGGAVEKVVERLQRKYLRRLLENKRRVRLHVRFALVSADYHLCTLNDIHVRSPGQSSLQALQGLAAGSAGGAQMTYDTPLLLECSWTYLYAPTTALTYSDAPAQYFVASCFRRAQSLLPVLQNLRGVVRNTEFFQRDNYRVLVHVRRTFVADMERLYRQQPSLQKVHKILTPYRQMPLDVVLECTVVSLGRCSDLVRPSGLLTGIVPISDFDLALSILEQTINQVVLACDQDRPLEELSYQNKTSTSVPFEKSENGTVSVK